MYHSGTNILPHGQQGKQYKRASAQWTEGVKKPIGQQYQISLKTGFVGPHSVRLTGCPINFLYLKVTGSTLFILIKFLVPLGR